MNLLFHVKLKNMNDYKLTEVTKCEDGFSVLSDCTGFFMQTQNIGNVTPKVGDTITLFFINGYGTEIIGMNLNGKKLYLKTPEQLEKEHAVQAARRRKEQLELFEENKEKFDQIFASFPALIRHRISLYKTYATDFRVEHEGYELHAILLGVKIYEACKIESKINNFANMDYKEQIKIIPEIETGETSGNQFQYAVYFAHAIRIDHFNNAIDLDKPTKKDLLRSYVMNVPLAISPVCGDPLYPKEKYIKKYIKQIHL